MCPGVNLVGICKQSSGATIFNNRCFAMSSADRKLYPNVSVSLQGISTALSLTSQQYLIEEGGYYCMGIGNGMGTIVLLTLSIQLCVILLDLASSPVVRRLQPAISALFLATSLCKRFTSYSIVRAVTLVLPRPQPVRLVRASPVKRYEVKKVSSAFQVCARSRDVPRPLLTPFPFYNIDAAPNDHCYCGPLFMICIERSRDDNSFQFIAPFLRCVYSTDAMYTCLCSTITSQNNVYSRIHVHESTSPLRPRGQHHYNLDLKRFASDFSGCSLSSRKKSIISGVPGFTA